MKNIFMVYITLLVMLSAYGYALECLQNLPNESISDCGVDTGFIVYVDCVTGGCENFLDRDYDSSVTATYSTGGIGNRWFISYDKPIGFINASWNIKDGNTFIPSSSTQNISLPASCLSGDTINISVYQYAEYVAPVGEDPSEYYVQTVYKCGGSNSSCTTDAPVGCGGVEIYSSSDFCLNNPDCFVNSRNRAYEQGINWIYVVPETPSEIINEAVSAVNNSMINMIVVFIVIGIVLSLGTGFVYTTGMVKDEWLLRVTAIALIGIAIIILILSLNMLNIL